MKAAVLEEYGEPLSIQEVEEPEPEPDGVVIELAACGICRSDWHAWHSADGMATTPLGQILGHEPAGTVIEVGADVKRFEVGDEIAVPAKLGDGVCHQCSNGHGNLCENSMTPGFQADYQGAFAEQMQVRAADYNAIQRPEGVSMTEMAALGCRFPTAFHALAHQADVDAGDWVAIHGCGGVGLSAVQIANAMGANVIGVDLDDEKLEMAEAFGAVATIDGGSEDVPAEVEAITDGGAHVSIDALGIVETATNSVRSLGKRGQHIQVGAPSGDSIPVPMDVVMGNELELYGSIVMPPTRYDEIFRMIAADKVDPGALITETVSLDQVSDRFEAMSEYQTRGFSVVTSFA